MASWPNGKAFDFDFRFGVIWYQKIVGSIPAGVKASLIFCFIILLPNVLEMHFWVLVHDITAGLSFIFVYLFVHVSEKCGGGRVCFGCDP